MYINWLVVVRRRDLCVTPAVTRRRGSHEKMECIVRKDGAIANICGSGGLREGNCWWRETCRHGFHSLRLITPLPASCLPYPPTFQDDLAVETKLRHGRHLPNRFGLPLHAGKAMEDQPVSCRCTAANLCCLSVIRRLSL